MDELGNWLRGWAKADDHVMSFCHRIWTGQPNLHFSMWFFKISTLLTIYIYFVCKEYRMTHPVASIGRDDNWNSEDYITTCWHGSGGVVKTGLRGICDVHFKLHPCLQNGGRARLEIKVEFHEGAVPLPALLALLLTWFGLVSRLLCLSYVLLLDIQSLVTSSIFLFNFYFLSIFLRIFRMTLLPIENSKWWS